MRHLLVVVLLCGCAAQEYKHSSHTPPPNAGKYDLSTCKLFDRFATQDVAVVIVKCLNTTLVVVAFSSEFYDVAAEEAANITVRLLKYRPILTPVFKTFLISADKKHSRPMIIFAVTGKI
ncbi:MAG: hypothetical protein WCT16_05150 [Candidatus Buchananbacteria bacterium]